MNSNLKKIIIYVGTAVITFVIVVLAAFLIQKRKISKMIDNFNEAYSSNDLSIVFYASSECHFCELEKPILKQIAKDYKLEYVNIDAALLSKNQKEDILKKLNIEGATPTTAIVKNNEVVALQVGYLDGNEYVNFFVKSGILKENSKYKPEAKINFINYTKLQEIENGIVVLGQTADQTCTDLRKTINKISKEEKLTFNYLNLRNLTMDEYYSTYDLLKEKNVNDYELLSNDSLKVPMILVIKDNKIITMIEDIDELKIKEAIKNK